MPAVPAEIRNVTIYRPSKVGVGHRCAPITPEPIGALRLVRGFGHLPHLPTFMEDLTRLGMN